MSGRDVVVVGAGIGGAATAYWLTRAGRKVTLLERYDLGHDKGSSHGASRIFRFSYDETHWVADAMESLVLWRELEEETGATLITTTGGFDIGPNVEAHRRSLDECDAVSELIDAAEAHRRFPLIGFPEDQPILFQPDAGISHADRCVKAFVDAAVARGAEFRPNTRVEGIEVGDDHVTVRAMGEELTAECVVVSAGAWGKSLLGEIGLELPVTVTRETVAYFSTGGGVEVPSVVDWTGDPPFFSLWDPATDGLKTGWHHAGAVIDDPDVPEHPEERIISGLSRWVAERFPGADPQAVTAETCLYTTTADERFVIERHGRVVVGSACSGHGFKFGPVSGRRIADLALEVL
ncbi:MAG: FAD-dependent oxidoreductase [Actinobacteria bacterium]|nr:FAD-dependent oxidoreductase [Actinomycetota bacterium]